MSRHRRMSRSVIAASAALLICGAIINIAEAWGCTLWAPVQGSGERTARTFTGPGVRGSFHGPTLWSYKSIQSGWPMTAFDHALEHDPESFKVTAHGAVALESFTPWEDGQKSYVPIRPIWPGFLFNTIFYAAILWMLWLMFAVPFALRRKRRRKRGLCPACAYPIGTWGGDVCTECGRAVRP